MGGNEVISKFLLISYKTSLKSRFSWDPFTISPNSHSLPYGYPMYLVSMERYSQCASCCDSFMAHRPFSTEYVGIYRDNIPSISFNILPSYIRDSLFQNLPPLVIQVPCQSSIDLGSI